jgi:hypothetical protein
MRPVDGDFIPAESVDNVAQNERIRTTWYQVDVVALSDYLKIAEKSSWLVEPNASLTGTADTMEFAEVCLERACPKWLVGWRDICRIPKSGAGHKFLLISSSVDSRHAAALLVMMSSLTFDYIARQKLGGTSLQYFTMKQLVAPAPSMFTDADLAFVVSRAVELVYTSQSMKPFAEELGYVGASFPWEEGRRALLRAELDAKIAKLYGLTRDQVRYILDPSDIYGAIYPSETFRMLKKNDIGACGEYRTARLVLDAWDRMERGELTC